MSSNLVTMRLKLNINLKVLFLTSAMFLLVNAGIGQDPGGNPDGPPPAVPFEDYMHWYIIGAGLVLALFKLYKIRKSVFS